MGIFFIILAAIAFVAFLAWFLYTKSARRCPICALKKIAIPRKITIDTSDFADYAAPLDKPVMGWSSWNTFAQTINEDLILETAEAMKASGLADIGYCYVNIDDCWQSSLRDINGRLQTDFTTFPSGMPALIEKINALGLKVGLYTSNGTLTCEDLPASLGREDSDAASLAEWGAEFFKYDFCHNHLDSGIAPPIEYLEFSQKGEKPFACITPDDVQYSGMGKTVKEKKLKSGKAMGFLSYGSGKAAFTLTAPASGEYIVTVGYRKRKVSKPPYLLIKTDSDYCEVLFPKARAFTPFGRVQAVIKLQQGENRIELSNPIVNRSDAAFLQYARMGKALQKATEGKKPIVFSICEWGFNRPYFWGAKAGNMWRTTPDIRATWSSILHIYAHNVRLWEYASQGHFNDPDMLEVGNGMLTDEENKSHFSLWCMMAAPLVLGNDIRAFVNAEGTPNTSNRTLQIVSNKALVDIDGDSLAKPAKRIKKGTVDILARPLENGDVAVCFFNKRGGTKKAAFDLKQLLKDDYFGLQQVTAFDSQELWTGDRLSGDTLTVSVPKHGVKVFQVHCQK
ncbi:MAG: alpha-galactosidase [Clostridia bacterium]|nr:alpha-galactosidase [Clostridia bacterium]